MPAQPKLIIFPAPEGEVPSSDYRVAVNGQPVFVYAAQVRHKILEKKGLWSHHLNCPAEAAAFAAFDFSEPVRITVTPKKAFASAQVLPTSAGIGTVIKDGTISFRVDRPRHLALLLDGSDVGALHFFLSPPETNVPDANDPDVIYFPPGVHHITTIRLKSNQTLYVAGGAVLKAALAPDAKGTFSEKWDITFYDGPVIGINNAQHVAIRGRGIIDSALIPHAARGTIGLHQASDVTIDGIIIRDTSNWAVTITNSERVSVTNIKEISGRLNSDGINTVSSSHVRIADCFVRNRDDSIVVKTTNPEREAAHISVENCTIWNDWGYALGVTYETRAAIHDVTFKNCDIIYGFWHAMGVHISDSATISNVTFDHINIENVLVSLLKIGIVQDIWGNDGAAGHIRDIRFSNIAYTGATLPASDASGFDATHLVENVTLEGMTFNGKALTTLEELKLTCNGFAKDVKVRDE